ARVSHPGNGFEAQNQYRRKNKNRRLSCRCLVRSDAVIRRSPEKALYVAARICHEQQDNAVRGPGDATVESARLLQS
ncbi:MAG: hypothetical protein RBT20_09950, partial [Syntrophales bacterium]|nr:hypothetical protein [Syntrophales bacterium]